MPYASSVAVPPRSLVECDPAIRAAAARVSDPNYLNSLSVSRSDSGVTFMYVGNNTKSPEAAALLLPFASGLDNHNVVKAAFVQAALESAGVHDANGDPLGLVVIASPCKSAPLSLPNKSITTISTGDFEPLARKYGELLTSRGIGKVMWLGFSQGASVAMSAAANSTRNNLDVRAVSVGDPANVVNRKRLRLVRDFMAQADWMSDVRAGGVDAYTTVCDDGSPLGFVREILGDRRVNTAMISGLGRAMFARDMVDSLANSNAPLFVGYGTESTVTPQADIEAQLKIATESNLLGMNDGQPRVEATAIIGAKHTWGDNLPMLASQYLRVATAS